MSVREAYYRTRFLCARISSMLHNMTYVIDKVWEVCYNAVVETYRPCAGERGTLQMFPRKVQFLDGLLGCGGVAAPGKGCQRTLRMGVSRTGTAIEPTCCPEWLRGATDKEC